MSRAEGRGELTPNEINALPERVRRYVYDLETRCDPAGDIRTISALRENQDALVTKVRLLEAEARRLREAIKKFRDGDYPRPRLFRYKPWREDEKPGKCKHGVFYFDECENCDDEYWQEVEREALATPAALPACVWKPAPRAGWLTGCGRHAARISADDRATGGTCSNCGLPVEVAP